MRELGSQWHITATHTVGIRYGLKIQEEMITEKW
nr:MAG TPA: MITOTIC CHECKPOINT SERINE/THREONINE-PROTEIN KINASE BUB1 CYCLE, TRANSFERASE, SPINDLE ASSEMBLY.6A [Caudoviricetes sp.]